MRLGTSWPLGAAVPRVVPSEFLPAITETEAAIVAATVTADAAEPNPPYWRLTWLEGRPRLVFSARPERVLLVVNGVVRWFTADTMDGAGGADGSACADNAVGHAGNDLAEDDSWI